MLNCTPAWWAAPASLSGCSASSRGRGFGQGGWLLFLPLAILQLHFLTVAKECWQSQDTLLGLLGCHGAKEASLSMSLLAGLLLLGFAAWQCLLYWFKPKGQGVSHRYPHEWRHFHLGRVFPKPKHWKKWQLPVSWSWDILLLWVMGNRESLPG